jgi:myo-inositol-1(or 4)-monophosphatase
MTDTAKLPGFLDRLASAAAKAIMPHFRTGGTVENKGENRFDPVTEADRGAEDSIRRLIAEAYPDHGILGEELGNERTDAEFVWVIDPIDGTRSFITGLPTWGTLIGLMHKGKPILGMMAQPFTGERFAGDGVRAWYSGPNGNRVLTTRRCPTLAEASLFTTTPAMFQGVDRSAYDRVEQAVRLARYGCDCYAYCMVAAGHADAVVEAGLQPYDIVALIPIVEGAGGRLTDWQGNSAAKGGRVVASGDARLHDRIIEVLNDTEFAG